jgi:hypothetical protein
MPPAKTGRERTRRKPEITIVQTKRGTFSKVTSLPRIFHIVLIKLILLKMDLTPARCNLKIARSTADPLWPRELLRGG